jgi:hypothetical protein
MAVWAYFLDTMKVNNEGWYEVRLPWIEGHPLVPRNFNFAKKRLENALLKLEESKLNAAYNEVLMNWLQAGIIEKNQHHSGGDGHYLPNRPIVKESGITRLRPVFDASARE